MSKFLRPWRDTVTAIDIGLSFVPFHRSSLNNVYDDLEFRGTTAFGK